MEFEGVGEEALVSQGDPSTLSVPQRMDLAPPAVHVMSPFHPSMRNSVRLVPEHFLQHPCHSANEEEMSASCQPVNVCLVGRAPTENGK